MSTESPSQLNCSDVSQCVARMKTDDKNQTQLSVELGPLLKKGAEQLMRSLQSDEAGEVKWDVPTFDAGKVSIFFQKSPSQFKCFLAKPETGKWVAMVSLPSAVLQKLVLFFGTNETIEIDLKVLAPRHFLSNMDLSFKIKS